MKKHTFVKFMKNCFCKIFLVPILETLTFKIEHDSMICVRKGTSFVLYTFRDFDRGFI